MDQSHSNSGQRMRAALLAVFLVGCVQTQTTHSQPPIEVVIITPLPLPRTKGEIVEVLPIPDSNEIPHTWMTGKEVEQAKHQRLIREHPECDCYPGDPLCSCM